jgi:hypothetical protein
MGKAARALPHRLADATTLALAEARKQCRRHRGDLADGQGPWPQLHGGHSGLCQPRVEYRAKGVGIALQTPAGYAADVSWHTY